MLDATPIPTTLGEFEVVRRIGRGGMGFVLEVRSRSTGVAYAAKLIVRAQDPLARERFRREAELLARCDRHPNVVKVHSFGEVDGGGLYMVMDLVAGENLEQLLEREGRLPPERAATLVRDLASALGFAHGLGIVHRDVKPGNVLLERDGTAKITDFGLATAVDLDALTRTGQFLGTMRYASPEQALGLKPTGPQTDVFALGAILFEAICGHTPYDEQRTPLEVMRELSNDTPVTDVRLLEPTCPDGLAEIVARALRKAPALRYADGLALARDLALYLEGKPTSASAHEAPVRPSRGPLVAAALALGLVVAALVLLPRLARWRGASTALGEATRALEQAQENLRHERTPGSLQLAVESSRRALDRAHEAATLGAPGTEPIAHDAAVALSAATTDLAERWINAGQAAEARALLEKLPGAPAALTPEERLLRARGLFMEGRLDAEETTALLALPLVGSRRADALELAGDAHASRGEVTAAAAAYGNAIAALPARSPALRLKHGVAAVAAHDDTTALLELKALVPDLGKLPKARDANAKLVGFAPALYRRGLAATEEGGERDLEAAWRLANPPVELAVPVASRWLTIAEPVLRKWNELYGTQSSVDDLMALERPIALASRAEQLDPTHRSQVAWLTFALIDNWAARSGVDAAVVERLVRGFLVETRHPQFLYLVAWAERRTRRDPATREESLALTREAIDSYPESLADEPQQVTKLADELAVVLVNDLSADELPLDEARLTRIAGRGPGTGYHVQRASYFRRRGQFALAQAELELAPPSSGEEPFGVENAEERIIVLYQLGRIEEAVKLMEAAPAPLEGRLRNKLRELCRTTTAELDTIPLMSERVRRVFAAGKTFALLLDVPEATRVLAVLKRVDAAAESAALEALIQKVKETHH